MTLDGDEIQSIIQDLGLEYKDYETPKKTVCSIAINRKFDAIVSFVATLRRCNAVCPVRSLHYHCCHHSKSG